MVERSLVAANSLGDHRADAAWLGLVVGGGAAVVGAGERVAAMGAGGELGLLQHKRECVSVGSRRSIVARQSGKEHNGGERTEGGGGAATGKGRGGDGRVALRGVCGVG